ncbi:MAG: ABC transporter ATP-binding protein [Casimicrobiaceae bacterium]
MSAAPPPYQVEHLSAGVTGRTLLRDLSLTVQRGEVWAILGSNGVGKTTLLHTLIGLHRADSGSIALCGRPLADWPVGDAAAVRGFLPQFIHDSFAARVIDMVLMGRHPHLSRWQWEGDDDLALAHAALEAVDLLAFAQRDVTTLSGGERQRVAIAALLTQDPLALLLDEPVAHLDLHHQITVLRHLSGLARTRDKAIVMSLHDPNLACRFATHALVMFGDATSRAGPIDTVVDAATLSGAYGHPIAEVAAGGRAVFVPE